MKLTHIALALFLLPVTTQAVQLPKQDWIDNMTTILPTALCKSDMYFRQCFRVSAEECEETALSATRVCLNKNRGDIPEILIQPKDGTHWGKIVGGCVGTTYEIILAEKRTNTVKCSDPRNWM